MKYKGAGDPMSYDDVLALVKTYITKEESLALIQKAYDFIMVKHKEQKRKSGEPYTIHLIWVAYILATLQTGQLLLQQDFFMMLWKIVMCLEKKWLRGLVKKSLL